MLATTLTQETIVEKLERQYSKENRVGCGWLRFTTKVENLADLRETLTRLFRGSFNLTGKGWNGYTHSEKGPLGVTLAYSPRSPEQDARSLGVKPSPNEGWLTVDVPQSAMDLLRGNDLIELFFLLQVMEGKVTRFDVYYDDYNKIVTPKQVYEQVTGGGVGVPRFKEVTHYGGQNIQTGKENGFTTYFGSRQSEKLVRYYDKAAESQGREDCYRWEVQFTGQYANAITAEIEKTMLATQECRTEAECIEVIGNWYKAIIKGAIAFHQLPEGVRQSEMPQNWAKRTPIVWWWDELLAGLEPARLTLNKVKPSLERIKTWFERQVAPSLALLREAYHHWGMPFTSRVHDWLDSARERWSDRHLRMYDDATITSPAY